MKQILKYCALVSVALFSFAGPVFAATPNLNITASGDAITLSVSNADRNAPVDFYYTNPGMSYATRATTNNWYTNGNGDFSTYVGAANFGIQSGAQLYVVVNGQQSSSYLYGYNGGCSYYCGSNISLSQSNISLNNGQSSVVTVYGGSNYYVSANSNSNVASYTMNGNQITVYGNNTGSTTLTICSNNSSSCVSLYITVNQSGCTSSNCGSLSLSQNNISLNNNQSSLVTIYGGNTYYVSSNSNSNVATYSISGNQIAVYAGNSSGNTTITICSNNSSSSCVSLYVTVNGNMNCSYSNCNNSLNLSQTSLNLNSGQSSTVTAYNNYGALYISSNSNSNAASATVNGNSINIYANNYGSTNISVCSNNNYQCGTIYVSVGGSGNNNSTFTLSQSSVTVNLNQLTTVYALNNYGSTPNLYVSNNSNSNVVSVSTTGNTIYFSGRNIGNATVTICDYSSSFCGTVYVTVNGYGSNNSLSLSQSNVSVNNGQNSTISIYGNGSYFVSSNSNSNIASANISGSNLNIYGLSAGSTSITICQYNNNGCATVYVTVNGSINNSGTVTLSQTSASIIKGQSTTVAGYGGSSFYVSSNSNPAVVSATASGGTITLYGSSVGTSYLNICATNSYNCASLSVSVTSGSVLGTTKYVSGTLVNDNGTVYITYKNSFSGFSNYGVFKGLGFRWSQVTKGSVAGMTDSGRIADSSRASHPWGSWILYRKVVYFVHENGLIPVSDWSTFLDNGGQSHLIVPANSWDLRLTILPALTSSDARLQ